MEASDELPRDWDITGHLDGYAIWFEGKVVAVWKTLVCARVACRIAQAGARDSNAALAACLATARRDA
jgi:hypothetical protein